MTQTLGINENNDIFIGTDGNLVIRRGILATRDACTTIAQCQQGECIYDTNLGIPNFRTIWNGNPNIPQFEAALRKAISSVSGVDRILNLVTTISGGVLTYTMAILTVYGQTLISGNFNVIS